MTRAPRSQLALAARTSAPHFSGWHRRRRRTPPHIDRAAWLPHRRTRSGCTVEQQRIQMLPPERAPPAVIARTSRGMSAMTARSPAKTRRGGSRVLPLRERRQRAPARAAAAGWSAERNSPHTLARGNAVFSMSGYRPAGAREKQRRRRARRSSTDDDGVMPHDRPQIVCVNGTARAARRAAIVGRAARALSIRDRGTRRAR